MKRNTTSKRWRGVVEAAKHNDEDAVRYWVEERHASVRKTDTKGQTAAHFAVDNDNLSILKFLLRHDNLADSEKSLIRLKDADGVTIFQAALRKGALHIIRYLLDELKADIDPLEPLDSDSKNTAIHAAAEDGQLPVLKYLIREKGWNVNARNKFLETPIIIATGELRFDVVKYFVDEANADATLTDWNRSNVLHFASYKGNLDVIKYLLDEKKIPFDINARNDQGHTYVYRAAAFNQLHIVKYFVEEKNADVNIADISYMSPIHQAAFFGYFDVVKYLGEKGANIDVKDEYGRRPVDVAVGNDVKKYLKGKLQTRNRRALEEDLFPRSWIMKPSELGIREWLLRDMIICEDVTNRNCMFSSTLTKFSSSHFDNFLLLAGTFFGNLRPKK